MSFATIKRFISKRYMKSMLKNEQVFSNTEGDMKHLFIKKRRSKKLLVVFSGFPPEGQKGGYNYVLKFRDFTCNKLYILDDFGSDLRGSYYLGKNKNFFVERLATELINKICLENDISKKDVITTGTSKGGFAALYFAYKNGYGTAVSGAPQVLLGNYLSHPLHKNILKDITGSGSKGDTEFLNDLLLGVIRNSNHQPHLYLHVSKNEHHYEEHMKPLIDVLDSKGIKYILNLGEYEDHGDVGRYFPDFARTMIQRKLTGIYDHML